MSALPNFLATRALTGDPGLPAILPPMPAPVDVPAPAAMPAPTPPPAAHPATHQGFAEALRQALPILIASIARAKSGPAAGAGLLQGYTAELEQQRVRQDHADAIDLAMEKDRALAESKTAADAQKRQADLLNFIDHTRASLDQHFVTDPAGWAATVNAADVAAAKAFGAPPGAVKAHPLLQFSDAKATSTATKEAQALLDAAQKSVGPEQWAEMLKTPEQFAVGGKPLSELLAASTVAVTKGGQGVAPGPNAPTSETESTFIARAITAENKTRAEKKLPPLSDTEKNSIALKARKEWMAQSGASGDSVTDMTPEGIDDTAMRYHIAGASALPTRINEDKRTRIINRNAEINAALGQKPIDAIVKGLAMKSDAASLTRSTTLADASRASQAKAEPLADLIGRLSETVGRTGIPLINQAILAGKTQIAGDTNASLLLNALTEFTAEYAKIVEGSANSSGGATVEGRRAAASLVTGAMAKGTVKAQLAQMKQIMNWSIQGADLARETIQNRMTAAGTPAAVTPPAPPPTGTPQKGDKKPLQLSTDQPGQPTGVQEFNGKDWIRIK